MLREEWQKFTERQARLLAWHGEVQQALRPLWMGGCALALLPFVLIALVIVLVVLAAMFCTITGLC